MENEFKFDIALVDDAIKYAKNAIAHSEGVNSKLDTLNNLLLKVNIPTLNLSNFSLAKTILTSIETLDSKIVEIKNDAISAMIKIPGFQYKLVEWIENGSISVVDIVSVSSLYMRDLVANDSNYYLKLKEAQSIHDVLREQGFSEEFMDSLSGAFCENLIRKNQMYTREGIVEMAYSFNGLLAMFGYKLDYSCGTGDDSYFDNAHHGLYLGNDKHKLKMLDCCNYYDWLSRCVGIDMYAYGAGEHYNYGIDIDGYANPTPMSEYRALPSDEYFYNGKPGDILEGSGHLRVIIDRTDIGYLTTEEGTHHSSMLIKHYTFEELARNGYHVSNMDAVYRNTTSGLIGVYKEKDNIGIPAGYSDILREAGEIRGAGIFFSPREIANELNLSPELENELIKQYNARSEHPNVGKLSELDIPNKDQIIVYPDNDFIPPIEEDTTPIDPSIPPVQEENKPIDPSIPPVQEENKPIDPSIPPVHLENKPTNILPENKFSDVLPGISNGKLSSMEIGKSLVNYEIHNVSNDTYQKYVHSLLDKGFKLDSDGSYILGEYRVVTTIAEDGTMSINLNVIR